MGVWLVWVAVSGYLCVHGSPPLVLGLSQCPPIRRTKRSHYRGTFSNLTESDAPLFRGKCCLKRQDVTENDDRDNSEEEKLWTTYHGNLAPKTISHEVGITQLEDATVDDVQKNPGLQLGYGGGEDDDLLPPPPALPPPTHRVHLDPKVRWQFWAKRSPRTQLCPASCPQVVSKRGTYKYKKYKKVNQKKDL